MAEIFFYHLERAPLREVLPRLLTLSLERGWRAIVKVAGEERLRALDDHLWSFSDESFLPHGTDEEPDPAEQPVLLTQGDANPNGAAIAFLVDGAALPGDLSAYQRVAVMLDGSDGDAVAAARLMWTQVRGAGHAVAYWQQDEHGRWQKRG